MGNTKKKQLSQSAVNRMISDVPPFKSEDKQQWRILNHEICQKIIVLSLINQLAETICSNLDSEHKKRMDDSTNSISSKLSNYLISSYCTVLENGPPINLRTARFFSDADAKNE
jgi:hypothetical protein